MEEQLFICKNAAICNLSCHHNKPHSSSFGCEKIGMEGFIDGECPKKLPIEPCIPYVPYIPPPKKQPDIGDLINAIGNKYTITIDSTTGKYTKNKYTKNVYIREEDDGRKSAAYHQLSIKPKNHDAPEEAKMTIIAKTRESALEEALKQLGWTICKD